MREHVKARRAVRPRGRLASSEALERFRAEGQDYKVELIEDLVAQTEGVDTVSLYTNGPFTDLCRGPHAPDDEAHQGVQAAVASPAPTGAATRTARCSPASTAPRSSRKEELDEHLERLEQARARDHRKLGRELGLFMFSRAVARARRSGCPTGMAVFNELDRALARGERRRAATARSRRRSSTTPSCGRPRATGTSTARTCTSRRSRTGRWASSR